MTMKKISITKRVPLFLLVVISLSSCQNPLGLKPAVSVSFRETAVIDSKKVVLLEGVSSSDLGLSLEQRRDKLTVELSRSLGRAVAGNSVVPFSTAEASSVISKTVVGLNLPNLLVITEADFAKIKADFPDLSDQEIHDQWLSIRKIYMDQVSALVYKRVVQQSSQTLSTSRSLSYGNGDLNYNDTTLTVFELAVMISYPFSAVSLNDTKAKAFELTAQYMGGIPDKTNEKSDSFRHSVWVNTMAKMGWGLKSEKFNWALDFSFAHELGGKYNGTGPMSSDMDWHNNAVGLEYYAGNATQTYTTFLWTWESGVTDPSYEDICNTMRAKALNATFVDRNLYSELDGRAAIAAVNGSLVYIVPDLTFSWQNNSTLRAVANSKFVCAENVGLGQLIANRTNSGQWELFSLIDLGGGKVALKSHTNAMYVCVELDKNARLTANRSAIGAWETFDLIHNNDGTVSLRSNANGLFVCADNAGNDPLIANRNAIGDWEKFWLTQL